LRALENRVLRRIFVPKTAVEVPGDEDSLLREAS
jgi:hypothetical protein